MSADDMSDGPSVSRDTFPRARKEHRCDGCHGTIRRGDRYLRCFGVWEGDASTWKYCAACKLLIDAIMSQPGNEGFVHGFDCGHSWRDVFESDPPDDVARLVFMTPDEAQKELVK